MSCLPILFGISLYTFYFWSHRFTATHPPGAFSQGLTVMGWVTDCLAAATLYSILVNLVLVIVLLGIGLTRGEYQFRFITFFIAGITVLAIIVMDDPFSALTWYLD